MSKMHVSLQMEKYNRVYGVYMILNIWKDIPLVAAPAPRRGTLLNSYPLILLDFVLCALLLFQLKKLECI